MDLELIARRLGGDAIVEQVGAYQLAIISPRSERPIYVSAERTGGRWALFGPGHNALGEPEANVTVAVEMANWGRLGLGE